MKLSFQYTFLLTLLSLSKLLFAQEEEPNRTSEFDLEVLGEYRYFYDDAQFSGQKDHFPSIAVRPEFSIDWAKQMQSLHFTGFYRLDVDEKRTHGDIRELYFQKVVKTWEFSLGLKKVYWGVIESNHLVDIINQTDGVESFDGEQKLGQPMLHLSRFTTAGTFDFFYLPYFRLRTLPGEKGRLRFEGFPDVLEADDIRFENGAEEWHQDFAFRWSHSVGILDIGIADFYGTGREPIFTLESGLQYAIINQASIDAQITHGSFLWKVEGIYRTSDPQDVFASAAGVEYTFGNVNKKGLDIGVLGEYLYDDRDELAFTGLQNDLFIGSRFAWNDFSDTQLLMGAILDLEKSSRIFSVEASRRLRDDISFELEARIFAEVDSPSEEILLTNFRQDSFVRVAFSKFF